MSENKHQCIQHDKLSNLKTEVEILKYSYTLIDRDIQELKRIQSNNKTLIITSLVAIIIGVIGVIAVLLEK